MLKLILTLIIMLYVVVYVIGCILDREHEKIKKELQEIKKMVGEDK